MPALTPFWGSSISELIIWVHFILFNDNGHQWMKQRDPSSVFTQTKWLEISYWTHSTDQDVINSFILQRLVGKWEYSYIFHARSHYLKSYGQWSMGPYALKALAPFGAAVLNLLPNYMCSLHIPHCWMMHGHQLNNQTKRSILSVHTNKMISYWTHTLNMT